MDVINKNEDKKMKNFLFLAYAAIFISIVIPCKVYSADITLGATTWYAQSELFYTQAKGPGILNNSKIKSDAAFLYGPTLAVRFSPDFNLTFVYLYGNFEAERDHGSSSSTIGSTTKFSRSDSDLALNYRLSEYFKAFAGIKYLSYGITPAREDSISFSVAKAKDIDIHTSYGPGIGLSATVPIYFISDNLFALATVSGLYLWGDHGAKVRDKDGNNPRNVTLKFNEYGFNSTLSLAYYIAPASVVVSLGGRFQYLQSDYDKNAIYLDGIEFTIWGATLTATYTFSI